VTKHWFCVRTCKQYKTFKTAVFNNIVLTCYRCYNARQYDTVIQRQATLSCSHLCSYYGNLLGGKLGCLFSTGPITSCLL